MTLRQKIFNTDLCDFLFSVNENQFKNEEKRCMLDLINGKNNKCKFAPYCHECINKVLNMEYEEFMKGVL